MSIKPVQFQGLIKGKSNPALIKFSDKRRYVVKFKGNRQGTRVLVNEFVAARLARMLSLPVPKSRVVTIPSSFIRRRSQLSNKNFTGGKQFASLKMRNCSPFPRKYARNRIGTIVNRKHFAGIIMFDYWLDNTDRGKANVLLRRRRNGRKYLYIIDHGNSFPGQFDWTKNSLNQLDNPSFQKRVIHWWLARSLSYEDYLSFAQKIKRIPIRRIWRVINSIPREWNVSRDEKKALFKYLVRKKRVLPQFAKKIATAHKTPPERWV